MECDRVALGWLRGLVEFGERRQEHTIEHSRGCGASLITILGMQKFRKEEDEYKVFALTDSDYCKASSTAR